MTCSAACVCVCVEGKASTVTGLAFPCPAFDEYTDWMPDFPQPLILTSSTMMGLSGIMNPNSFI